MAPPLANTPASGSQQAAQLSPRAAPPAECLHGIGVSVENLDKIVGLLHGFGVSVENLDKKVGLLHGIGVSVENFGIIT